MASPAVSVIMPAFNSAPTIGRAVESVLGQTLADLELVIVHDESVDSTLDIISTYARTDPRIKSIRNHRGKMLARALNVGIANANAAYIARMDADDLAMPDRLRRQHDFMERQREIAIVGTGMSVIDDSDSQIGRMPAVIGAPQIATVLTYAPALYHPTWFGRREAFQRLGGYRDFRYAEDYDFLLRARDSGFALANLEFEGVAYRRNPSHRARIVNHKAANYARALARERQRLGTDGFSEIAFQKAVMESRWPWLQRRAERRLNRAFEGFSRGNALAPLNMMLGLALSPASAEMTLRKAWADFLRFRHALYWRHQNGTGHSLV